MLKKDLDTKDLLESIEHEMEVWNSYYMSNQEITNMKIKEILKIKEDISLEKLQNRINKCKDEEKIQQIEKIINTGNMALFESQISLRTLTWVRSLMIDDENKKEDE